GFNFTLDAVERGGALFFEPSYRLDISSQNPNSVEFAENFTQNIVGTLAGSDVAVKSFTKEGLERTIGVDGVAAIKSISITFSPVNDQALAQSLTFNVSFKLSSLSGLSKLDNLYRSIYGCTSPSITTLKGGSATLAQAVDLAGATVSFAVFSGLNGMNIQSAKLSGEINKGYQIKFLDSPDSQAFTQGLVHIDLALLPDGKRGIDEWIAMPLAARFMVTNPIYQLTRFTAWVGEGVRGFLGFESSNILSDAVDLANSWTGAGRNHGLDFSLKSIVAFDTYGTPAGIVYETSSGSWFNLWDKDFVTASFTRDAMNYLQVVSMGADGELLYNSIGTISNDYILNLAGDWREGPLGYFYGTNEISLTAHLDCRNGFNVLAYHDYASEGYQQTLENLKSFGQKVVVSVQKWTSDRMQEGYLGAIAISGAALATGAALALGGIALGAGELVLWGATIAVSKAAAFGIVALGAWSAVSMLGGVYTADEYATLVGQGIDPWQAAIKISQDNKWLGVTENVLFNLALIAFTWNIGSGLMQLGQNQVALRASTARFANWLSQTKLAQGLSKIPFFQKLSERTGVHVLVRTNAEAAMLARYAVWQGSQIAVGSTITLRGASALAVHLLKGFSLVGFTGEAIHLMIELPLMLNTAASILMAGSSATIESVMLGMPAGGLWNDIKREVALMFVSMGSGTGLGNMLQGFLQPETWAFVAVFSFLGAVPTYMGNTLGIWLGGFGSWLGSVVGVTSIGGLRAGAFSAVFSGLKKIWDTFLQGVWEEGIKEPILGNLLLGWLPESAREFFVELFDIADGRASGFHRAALNRLQGNVLAATTAAPQALSALTKLGSQEALAIQRELELALQTQDFDAIQRHVKEALTLIGTQETGVARFDQAIRDLRAMQASGESFGLGILDILTQSDAQRATNPLVKTFGIEFLTAVYEYHENNPFVDLSGNMAQDVASLAVVTALSLKLHGFSGKFTIGTESFGIDQMLGRLSGENANIKAAIKELELRISKIADPAQRNSAINAFVANLATAGSVLTYTDPATGQSVISGQVLANAIWGALGGQISVDFLTLLGVDQNFIAAFSKLSQAVQETFLRALSERSASADAAALSSLMLGAQMSVDSGDIEKTVALARDLGASRSAQRALRDFMKSNTRAALEAAGAILTFNGGFDIGSFHNFSQLILIAAQIYQGGETMVAALRGLGLQDAAIEILVQNPHLAREAGLTMLEHTARGEMPSSGEIAQSLRAAVLARADQAQFKAIVKTMSGRLAETVLKRVTPMSEALFEEFRTDFARLLANTSITADGALVCALIAAEGVIAFSLDAGLYVSSGLLTQKQADALTDQSTAGRSSAPAREAREALYTAASRYILYSTRKDGIASQSTRVRLTQLFTNLKLDKAALANDPVKGGQQFTLLVGVLMSLEGQLQALHDQQARLMEQGASQAVLADSMAAVLALEQSIDAVNGALEFYGYRKAQTEDVSEKAAVKTAEQKSELSPAKAVRKSETLEESIKRQQDPAAVAREVRKQDREDAREAGKMRAEHLDKFGVKDLIVNALKAAGYSVLYWLVDRFAGVSYDLKRIDQGVDKGNSKAKENRGIILKALENSGKADLITKEIANRRGLYGERAEAISLDGLTLSEIYQTEVGGKLIGGEETINRNHINLVQQLRNREIGMLLYEDEVSHTQELVAGHAKDYLMRDIRGQLEKAKAEIEASKETDPAKQEELLEELFVLEALLKDTSARTVGDFLKILNRFQGLKKEDGTDLFTEGEKEAHLNAWAVLLEKTGIAKALIAEGDSIIAKNLGRKETLRQLMGLYSFSVALAQGWAGLHSSQVMAAWIMAQGWNIAELATGEGKSAVGALAAFVNSYTKKGSFIVTTTDMLAKRDAEGIASRVSRLTGRTVGL
ncbi:MAG TPA: hypothetical protein P5561_05535, partial [Candidatus Omnitrophota bacterium]|nr:hypothetical protein [Candidatus Omnitrophota bacterium]